MGLKQSKFKNLSIFFLIPIILSIGLASSISFFDLIQEAEAVPAVGPQASKSYGSKNERLVCGDRLCSEDEPTGQQSSSTRITPSTPLPKVSEEIEEGLGLSPMIDIETHPVGAGRSMSIEVEFEDPQGNNYLDVNYNIKVTQEGTVILNEQGVYDQNGENNHQTMPLPSAASSDDPVDVEVEFLGFGTNEPLTGPIGEYETIAVVPEFGTIAVMILGIAIISIIAVTARSKVFPRL